MRGFIEDVTDCFDFTGDSKKVKKESSTPLYDTTPRRTKESRIMSANCAATRQRYFIRLDKRSGESEWHPAECLTKNISGLSGNSTGSSEYFEIGDNYTSYKGCPYCGNKLLAQCTCGAWFCSKSDWGKKKCPVCGKKHKYSYRKSFITNRIHKGK